MYWKESRGLAITIKTGELLLEQDDLFISELLVST